MSSLAVDPTAQVLGLVLNGLLTAAGIILLWLVRLAYKAVKQTLAQVHHIDECLDRTQEALLAKITNVGHEVDELKIDAKQRNSEHTRMREEIAYLKAMVGVGLDESIDGKTKVTGGT